MADRNRNDRDYGREDFQTDDKRFRGPEGGRTGSRRDFFGGGDYGSQGRFSSGDERRFGGEDRFTQGQDGGGRGDYRGGVGSGESFMGGEPRRHSHGYDRYGSEGFRGDYGGQSGFGSRNHGQSRFGQTGDEDGRGFFERSSGAASGRPYGGGERGRSEGGRDFWDKASDEVSSWFGDRDAERRRDQDLHRGRGPKGYNRSDDRIKEDVNDRLTEDGWLDASNVTVEVREREVTLSGTVSDRASKRRAEDIAESVSGVGHVQNNLRVQAAGHTSDVDVDRSGMSGAVIAKSGAGGQR